MIGPSTHVETERSAFSRLPAWHLAVFAAAAVVLYWNAFSIGMGPSDSYRFNMTWGTAISEQMAAGEIYPRWLYLTWSGAGSPDFYFYPPLFFLVAGAIGLATGLQPETAMVAAAALFHALSGMGGWQLARRLDFGAPACLATGLAVMAAPYHLLDWTMRGAFAELALYGVIGFVLAAGVEVLRDGRGHAVLALSVALAVLAHILALPILGIGGLCMLAVLGHAAGRRRVLACGLAAALGLLIPAIYLLPAITLRDTVSEGALFQFPIHRHVFGPVAFADRLTGWIYAANTANAVVILIACLFARRVMPQAVAVIALVTLACWALWSPLAAPLYEVLPLKAMQFPWRFSLLADMAWALAVGLAVQLLRRPAPAVRRIGGAVALAISVQVLALLQPAFWRPIERPTWDPWLVQDMRIVPVEWLPAGTVVAPLNTRALHDRGRPWPPLDGDAVALLEGDGRLTVLQAAPREIVVETACPTGCTVTFRRHAWAYWRLTPLDGGEALPITAGAPHPLVRAALPPGEGRWRLALTRPAVEYWGWALSGLGLLILALSEARRRRRAGG